jgi:peptidylprolyl isomerase
MNAPMKRLLSRLILAILLLVPLAGKASEQDVIPAPENVAGPPADAVVTESGLASKVLQGGRGGKPPGPQDVVEVHYTGWTTDGKMFDSSVIRGKKAGLPLERVIAGWQEGLQLMVVGEKRRLWIPQELAYKGAKGKPAGMLVFDIELFRIDRRSPPPAPTDVAGPTGSFEMTRSGIASRVLRQGSGSEHPKRHAKVTVNYSGWTTDGKLFDSTVSRGKPATFRLDQVIRGWTEGVQLMVEGEKRRFWIPENLAYGGQKGYPAGMLVFDIELLEIDGRGR